MMRNLFRYRLTFIGLIIFGSNTVFANQAYFETDSIYEGDIAVMVVEFQNDQPSLFLLDTTVLQSDFEVLRVSSSVGREVVDDRLVNTMRWVVNLHPLRAGIIQTRSMDIRGYKTPRLRLEVNKIPLGITDKTRVRVEASTDRKRYFQGQQIKLTMRLFHNRPIIEGDFGEPMSDDFRRYRSGQERRYQKEENGELFDVIERQLVLIAGKPGVVFIPPIEFKGLMDTINGVGDNPQRRLLRRSAPIDIVIKPQAVTHATDYWIPASDVQATQIWGNLKSDLNIGASVIRRLSLVVKGIPAENLPTDLFSATDSTLEVYSDRESIRNEFEKTTIVGRLDQDYVVVLAKSGEIRIPDINIAWWNVLTNKEEVTVLPGKTINVKAAVSNVEIPGVSSSQMLMSGFPAWQKINTGLIIFGLMIFSLGLMFSGQIYLQNINPKFRWWQLFRACRQDNPVLAKQQVLLWAARQWPELRYQGLLSISSRKLSGDLSKALIELDACLYQKSPAPWNGNRLWKSFWLFKLDSPSKIAQQSTGLPALYPD
jgi:hypothetical protein